VENVNVQAAFDCDLELVKRLLKDLRVDLGYNEDCGIFASVEDGNIEVVKPILGSILLMTMMCCLGWPLRRGTFLLLSC
jgi:hypothetical protein